MHRSSGLLRCSNDPARAGSGRIEDRIAAVRITDAKRSQNAVQPLCRHSRRAIFQPAENIFDQRPAEFAGKHDIDRAAILQHHMRLEQPPARLLRRSSIRPWRMPRPMRAWRRGRSPPGSAVAHAVRGGAPMSRAAPGDRRSRHHPGRPRWTTRSSADSGRPFSTSLIRPSADPGRAGCLRRPSNSGTESRLADIKTLF